MLSLLDSCGTPGRIMRRRTYFRSTPPALMVAKPLQSHLRKQCRWDSLLCALITRYSQKLPGEMPYSRDRETQCHLLRNWSNLQAITNKRWRWGAAAELSQNDTMM